MIEATEYCILHTGGDKLVFSDYPEVEEIYPLTLRISDAKKHNKVFKRTIVIIEDWEEVK